MGVLFLADLGLAARVEQTVGAYMATHVKGTFNFMSPEMFDDEAVLTKAVDIWAAACCVLEMLTGQEPFAGCKMQHMVKTVGVLKQHPPLHVLPPRLQVNMGVFLVDSVVR